ncbi:MAG: FeoB small GTPase domain-containing protein [Bacteriovoracaceae bacterium]
MKKFTVLLVGTPNSGKSTIFNLLSGSNRKVSNYAGVTVDTGISEVKSNKNYPDVHVSIVDLPGIYNLNPTSVDEAITTGTVLGENLQIPQYDLVALVLDINKLENTLFLILNLKKVLLKISF